MHNQKRVIHETGQSLPRPRSHAVGIAALQRVTGLLLLCFATNHRLRRDGDEMNLPSSIGQHEHEVLAAQNLYVTSGGPKAIGLYRVPAHERRVKPSGAQV